MGQVLRFNRAVASLWKETEFMIAYSGFFCTSYYCLLFSIFILLVQHALRLWVMVMVMWLWFRQFTKLWSLHLCFPFLSRSFFFSFAFDPHLHVSFIYPVSVTYHYYLLLPNYTPFISFSSFSFLCLYPPCIPLPH